MRGITADFPVLDAPVMMFTFPAANERRRGSAAGFLYQRTIFLISKRISQNSTRRIPETSNRLSCAHQVPSFSAAFMSPTIEFVAPAARA